jgi:hypothetical protein
MPAEKFSYNNFTQALPKPFCDIFSTAMGEACSSLERFAAAQFFKRNAPIAADDA